MSQPSGPREDALVIWRAGVEAVRSDRLVQTSVQVTDNVLRIGPREWPLHTIRRIEVVGAGKAGAGMAQGLETALGPQLLAAKHVEGWINVPADCLRPLTRFHLHPARAAGVNEPSIDGVLGSGEILGRVAGLSEEDLCICLISGGGSALLPAPRSGISLDDLRDVARRLSDAGATIQQLNAVRRRLSRTLGGQLARTCRAGELITLIISDVIGDSLEAIASGPTIVDDERLAADRALRILDQFPIAAARINPAVRRLLEADRQSAPPPPPVSRLTHLVIGNNDTAVQAAARSATEHGYDVEVLPQQSADTTAEQAGVLIADTLAERLGQPQHTRPFCIVSGGEPVVRLMDADQRGLGGRNQQLVLAALVHRRQLDADWDRRQVILSGGTDGEDGPTDAAGALVDAAVIERMLALQLDASSYLHRNDAYSFFDATGGLLRTGPTHTNVCDLRVALIG